MSTITAETKSDSTVAVANRILRLKRFRHIALGTMIVPGALLFLGYAATELRERGVHFLLLPVEAVYLYFFSICCSPIIGTAGLILLAASKDKFKSSSSAEEQEVRRHVSRLSWLNIFIIIFWILAYPFVFFGTGSSR